MTFVQFLRSINSTKVFIVYKRKNQNMKFNDICVSNDFKFDDDASWKKNIIKKKKYIKNLMNQFVEFLIFKFSESTKETRLKSERIQRMQIKNELLKRKKELLLKMLFNHEIALFWDFIKKDSSFWSFVVYENSHNVSWSLTSFWMLNSQSAHWNCCEDDEKSNQKRCVKILLRVLSKFLISRQKEREKKISSDQCRSRNESNHDSRCESVFCNERIFRRICWLRHCFADEFVFRIWSIIVDWKV
jgi:hypothetical protein